MSEVETYRGLYFTNYWRSRHKDPAIPLLMVNLQWGNPGACWRGPFVNICLLGFGVMFEWLRHNPPAIRDEDVPLIFQQIDQPAYTIREPYGL